MANWEDDDHDYDYSDGDEDEWLEECALMPNGQCLKAGSEECDWECPMRNSEHFVGSEAWRKKQGRKRRDDGRQNSLV